MTQEPMPKSARFAKLALTLGLVVMLNVFFSVAVAIVFPIADYSNFCKPYAGPVITTQAACEAQQGIWYPPTTAPAVKATPASVESAGYCDTTTLCSKTYDELRNAHALRAFLLMFGFGVVSLVVGLVFSGAVVVGSGFSYGGVLALVIGSIEYWGTAGNWLRLALAAVGVVALIVIGVRKFKD